MIVCWGVVFIDLLDIAQLPSPLLLLNLIVLRINPKIDSYMPLLLKLLLVFEATQVLL